MNLFDKQITDTRIVFKYALGKSREYGKEFHNFHEIIYFIRGNARFISEEISVKLEPDTLVIIPKEKYHKFVFEEDDSYLRCVFNFYESESLSPFIAKSVDRIYILSLQPKLKLIFDGLISLCDNPIKEKLKIEVLKSSLILLLYSLCDTPKTKFSENAFNLITKRALDVISANIKCHLSVGDIAKRLNVSVSTLSHVFKKDVNISIYKFIQKKRLIEAAGLISKGVPATMAALEYGFNDYAGFFRQYKALFGYAPSKSAPLFKA